MNAIRSAMMGLAIVIVNLASSAQGAKVPIRQIERDAQLSARVAVPANEAAIGHSSESFSSSSYSSGFVLPPPVAISARTLSTGYYLLNGFHLGMAVFDVEMTQHCIANHHCVEGNPLMPSSQAGQLGMNFALVSYSTFISYRLKKRESKLWILSPTVGISAHTIGVLSGFRNR